MHKIDHFEIRERIIGTIAEMKGDIDLNILIGVLRELNDWYTIQRDKQWIKELSIDPVDKD